MFGGRLVVVLVVVWLLVGSCFGGFLAAVWLFLVVFM